MPPRTPTRNEYGQVLDVLRETRTREEKAKTQRDLYTLAILAIENAPSNSEAPSDILTTVNQCARGFLEIKRRSPWLLQEPAKYDGEGYVVGFRCVQQQHCLLGDPLLPKNGAVDLEEWRQQPVILEMCVRHEQTNLEEIFPVARFTPHGINNQLCDIEWAHTDPDGSIIWRDIDVTSTENSVEVTTLKDTLYLLQ